MDDVEHARAYFKMRFPKLRNRAEDFAQWCALKWLEGTYQNGHKHLLNMCIDYLRTEVKHHENRAETDAWFKLGSIETVFQSDVLNIASHLEGLDRAIMILAYKWEFSHEEIGECFGISTKGVGQRLFRIRGKVKRKIKYG